MILCRWVGGAAILLGVSCFLASLPYFVFGKADEAFSMTDPEVESDLNHFCHDQEEDRRLREINCAQSRKKETLPAILLLVSCNFLTGIGTAVYYSTGTAYLEEIIENKHSAVYMGKSLEGSNLTALKFVFSLNLLARLIGGLICSLPWFRICLFYILEHF